MSLPPAFFSGPISTEDDLHNKQEEVRSLLHKIKPPLNPKPKQPDYVFIKTMAEALKAMRVDIEEVFCNWAKTQGVYRHRAKGMWSEARGNPDAIEALIDEKNQAEAEAQRRTDRFSPQTAAALEAMPLQPWRVKHVALAVGIAAIYGASASGKSFLGVAMAAAIAAGLPFFRYVTKPAAVLYVGLEGEGGYRGRVLAWQQHHGRKMPDGVRFLLQPFRLTDPQDVADLAAICPLGCVVFIDTLNRASPGMDENSSKDMGAVIEGAKTLQRLTGGLVVLIAHTGKDSAKGLRGHSSLFAALDAAILVKREGEVRSWRVDKAKDGKDGEEHRFRLNVVEVGVDEDGDAITSCVVVPDSSVPAARDRPLTPNQKLGIESFNEAAGAHGGVDEQGNFIGLHLSNWRPVFYRMSPADSDTAKKKAFERARRDLVDLGRLAVEHNVYRLAGDAAMLAEKCIAEVLKSARDRTTRQRQAGDMSRVAYLPFGDDSDNNPLGLSPCPSDARAELSARPERAPRKEHVK